MTKQKNILGEIKRKPNNKILLNIGLCEKPECMNFAQAFLIVIMAIVAFGFLFPWARNVLTIQSVETCELRGDCTEVIKNLNGNI